MRDRRFGFTQTRIIFNGSSRIYCRIILIGAYQLPLRVGPRWQYQVRFVVELCRGGLILN